MKRIVRAVVIGVAAVGLMIPSVAMASTTDDEIDQLVTLNPGMTRSQVIETVQELADKNGQTFDETVSQSLAELLAAQAAAAPQEQGISPLSSGGGSVTIKNADHKGDVYYAPAGTLFITYGHVGIYWTTKTTVEAPGSGKKSATFTAASRWVPKGAVKQYVTTTQPNRDAAANYAYNYLRNHDYNPDFLNNKQTGIHAGAAYNCSQLVWIAYINSVGIDLDSNGGNSVMPANIRDSSRTITYATVNS